VTKFKYLVKKVENRNCIHWKIKRRLNSGMLSTIFFRFSCLPVSYEPTD
jgi:hypothetical protein